MRSKRFRDLLPTVSKLHLARLRCVITKPVLVLLHLISAVERIDHAAAQPGPRRSFKAKQLLHVTAPELIVDTIASHPDRVRAANDSRQVDQIAHIRLIALGQVLRIGRALGMH